MLNAISGFFWILLSKHSEMLALSAVHFGGARPKLTLPGRAAKNTVPKLNVPVCEVGSVTDLAFPLAPHNLAALIICLYPYSESQGQPGQQARPSHTCF